MAQLARSRGARVTDRVEDLGPVDGLIAQDAPAALALTAYDAEAPLLFVCHGTGRDGMAPPQGPDLASRVVVMNDRVRERVSALAAGHDVLRLRQPIDMDRFAPRAGPRRQRHARAAARQQPAGQPPRDGPRGLRAGGTRARAGRPPRRGRGRAGARDRRGRPRDRLRPLRARGDGLRAPGLRLRPPRRRRLGHAGQLRGARGRRLRRARHRRGDRPRAPARRSRRLRRRDGAGQPRPRRARARRGPPRAGAGRRAGRGAARAASRRRRWTRSRG